MEIGIFGGTFDPPHLAHLILAEEARYQLNLKRVLWVLTPVSPLKPDATISPVDQRIALLDAALSDNPAFEISRVDIDRSPPHYAFETLRILAESHSKENLIYLMGGDSLRDLPIWKQPQVLLDNCSALAVMRRQGDEIDMGSLESIFPHLRQKIRWIDAPLLEISGTQIRERLKQGGPVRYLLPPAVYRIITDQKLYQT
jgi:nicotinate-nucleotide adenylyltransferase